MYRLAYKHIELFQKIPFAEFSANSGFIKKVITEPEKYASYENILKCYYFIADEMWDPLNIKPLITDEETKYCFYDFIRKRPDFLRKIHYKPIKLFNGIFNDKGQNRHYKRYHGLVAQPKSKGLKEEAYKLRDMFISYAYIHNNGFRYYKRNEFELPTEWAEHLYELLNKLSEYAVFFYRHRGATTLAQEMISVLSNQFLFVYATNRINYSKEDKQKVLRQIREKKEFMFGELKHNKEHFKEIKARQKSILNSSCQNQN